MTRPLMLAATLLVAHCLHADALGDLKGRLATLKGADPVKASVDYQTWSRTLEDKKPRIVQGRATAWVEDGPQGLRLHWSRALLQQAVQEARARAQDPEKETGTRSALRGIDPLEIGEKLNYAEALLREMEEMQAQLQEERADTFHGQPAKLLVLKAMPRMREDQRKAMKEFQATFRIWLGADGLPLGCHSSVAFKASKFLIKFEGGNSEEVRLMRSGDRLVATSIVRESHGSGLGQQSQNKTTLTITLN